MQKGGILDEAYAFPGLEDTENRKTEKNSRA
jgi:hypothetical protein